MTAVSIDQHVAKELVQTNLAVIKSEIEEILQRWNEEDATEMVEKTRRGELPEAELDAIALTNLIDKQKELDALLIKIGG